MNRQTVTDSALQARLAAIHGEARLIRRRTMPYRSSYPLERLRVRGVAAGRLGPLVAAAAVARHAAAEHSLEDPTPDRPVPNPTSGEGPAVTIIPIEPPESMGDPDAADGQPDAGSGSTRR